MDTLGDFYEPGLEVEQSSLACIPLARTSHMTSHDPTFMQGRLGNVVSPWALWKGNTNSWWSADLLCHQHSSAWRIPLHHDPVQMSPL